MEGPRSLISRFKGIKVDSHLAVVVAMLAAVSFLYYADQVPQIAIALSRAGYPLTRHAMQRILFLIPIGYAALERGLIGGGITLFLSALIMMPRALFISPTPLDTLSEVGATAFTGGALAWLIDKLGRERLERESSALRLQAAVEVTDLISRSLDLQQVLQETLDAIVGRLDVGPRGGIFLLDEETQVLYLNAQHGLSSEFVAEEATVAVGECLCGAAARSGEVIWSVSCPDDPRHVRQGESSPHFHLVIPLKVREKVFGVAFFYPRRAIEAAEMGLFATIGGQIGMAIKNARIYEQTDAKLARRISGLALLTDIAQIAGRSPELSHMLSACVDRILQFWEVDGPAIYMLEADKAMWKLAYHRDLVAELLEHIRETPFAEPPLAIAAAEEEAVLISDLAKFAPRDIELLERLGRRVHVVVPLRSREELIGALVMRAKEPDAFRQEDLQLLTLVGSVVASGIERIRLQTEVKRLSALEERGRIAREMHDRLSQTLGCLNLECLRVADLLSSSQPDRARKQLEQLRQLAREAYEDVREGIFALRLAASKEKSFISNILTYLGEFEEQSGIEAQLVIDGDSADRLSPTSELQLIRIIQEALINIRKHSTASKTLLRIESVGEEVTITIEDDGQGFDPDIHGEEARRHFGLEFMRERAKSINGILEIETEPGRGTKIIVKVPLAEEKKWLRPNP